MQVLWLYSFKSIDQLYQQVWSSLVPGLPGSPLGPLDPLSPGFPGSPGVGLPIYVRPGSPKSPLGPGNPFGPTTPDCPEEEPEQTSETTLNLRDLSSRCSRSQQTFYCCLARGQVFTQYGSSWCSLAAWKSDHPYVSWRAAQSAGPGVTSLTLGRFDQQTFDSKRFLMMNWNYSPPLML